MKKWENHTLAYIAELINTSILELWKAYTSTEESWTGYLYDQWKHPRKKKKVLGTWNILLESIQILFEIQRYYPVWNELRTSLYIWKKNPSH